MPIKLALGQQLLVQDLFEIFKFEGKFYKIEIYMSLV